MKREKKCQQERANPTIFVALRPNISRDDKLTPLMHFRHFMSALRAPIYAGGKAFVASIYAFVGIIILAHYGALLSKGFMVLMVCSVSLGEYLFRYREFNYYNKQK